MRSLIKFFALTFIVGWVCWTAAAAITGGTASLSHGFASIRGTLIFSRVMAPAVVAPGAITQTEGRAGTLLLRRRIIHLPNDVRWYVFALGFFAVIKLTVSLLHRIVTGAWPPFGQTPFYLVLMAICISTPVQAGDEIGWRGYAL